MSYERDRFFELSMDLLCIAGTDGYFKELNSAWEHTLGFSRDELYSKPFIEFIHLDDRPRTLAAMNQLVDGQSVTNFENRYRAKDGSYRWLSWIVPAPESESSVLYAAARVITEGNRALRESEERYRLLTDATFDGIAIHDQGLIIEVNSGLERMFGYGSGELIGKHVLDLVADESREMVISNMKKGQQGPYESVGRRKDGSTFYGEVVIKPYRYKGREVRLVAGRDITERKQMEQALRQVNDELEQHVARRTQELVVANDALCVARAWQRDLIEAIPGIVWECDARTWKFSFVSHQAELVLGYPVWHWLDEPDFWQAHIHPDDRDWVMEYCLAASRDKRKYSFEYRMIAADGRTLWLQDTVTVELDELGPAILRGIMVDITERRQAEEALRKSEEQLRKVLEEREQLSQDLHDNIIQTIYAIGMSLEECRYLFHEDHREADKKLEHAVASLNRVISDVRVYIVWDKHEEISGQQFCAKLTELAMTMGSSQGIHFSLDLAPEAAQRLTPLEAFHILHIVQEGMSNSLRHSKGRSGLVSLQMQRGQIHLEIKDDGVGFNSEKTVGQGNGLQNMTARAQKLGAQLQITSKPGSGVQILVELPLED